MDIRDPHRHGRRATFEHLQPMNMSKYLLSDEPHTQSFGTSAKFDTKLLQEDNLIDKEVSRGHTVLKKMKKGDYTVPSPSRLNKQVIRHPYFL